MRLREEIRKTIDAPKKSKRQRSHSLKENIARITSSQVLDWVLGEVDNPLTY